MKHHASCTGHCAKCRHARFNPGPPSNPRRLNFYGHFVRKYDAKKHRVALAHADALAENGRRGRLVDAVRGA